MDLSPRSGVFDVGEDNCPFYISMIFFFQIGQTFRLFLYKNAHIIYEITTELRKLTNHNTHY